MTTHTTTTSARALLDSAISEKAFQAQVIRLAELNNWLVYHTWNSQHSAAGFPDLVLVRHGCIVFAELKSQKGRVSPEQHVWIQALSLVAGIVSAAGVIGGVRVFLWRPSDWPIIERVLAGNATSNDSRRTGAA